MESSAVDNESVSTPVDESTENKEKKKERERQRKERRERKFREWIFIGRKDERGGMWWKRPQICATTARRNNKFRVLLDISPCDMQKPWVISAVRESTFPPPSTYTPKWTQREDPSFPFPSKQFTRWLRASSRFRYTRNRRVIRFPRFFFRKMLGSLYIFTWSEMLLITRIYRIYRIARSMELERWNQRDRSFDSNIRSNRHCEKSGLGRSKWRREGRRISLEGEEGVSLPEIGSRFSAKRKKGEDSWGTLKNELVAATNNVACATGDR